MLIACGASAAVKVTTQHFEVKDSVRLLEKDDPKAPGFLFAKYVDADWPVAINGKHSTALNDFLLDKVFQASENRDVFPYNPGKIDEFINFAANWVQRKLRTNNIVEEYVIKQPSSPGLPALNVEENPMSFWYEMSNLNVSHSLGNIVFFTEYDEIYYGGAHPMHGVSYYCFDAALERPIHIKDIVKSPRKLLRMLPAYDHRDKDCKWWDNVDLNYIENFYIKDGQLVVVFDPYAIGPYSDGIIHVKVPLKTLKAKHMLTTYGKQLLKLKN